MNITLSPENAAFIAKYAPLTGFDPEKLANRFLGDYLQQFEGKFSHPSSVEEAIGSMRFADKESAERVQAWLLERVSKRYHLNSIETRINSNADGTFDVSMTVPDRAGGGRYQIA
jgi:hypothetical protein